MGFVNFQHLLHHGICQPGAEVPTACVPVGAEVPTACVPVGAEVPTACVPVSAEVPTACVPVGAEVPTACVSAGAEVPTACVSPAIHSTDRNHGHDIMSQSFMWMFGYIVCSQRWESIMASITVDKLLRSDMCGHRRGASSYV